MGTDYDLIILGAGPAGLTAGLYAGRARLRTLVLGDRPGGSPVLYDRIDNIPGFPDGVAGAQLMMAMVRQVDDLGVERVVQDARSVAPEGEWLQVTGADGAGYSSRAVIVATGSEPARLAVPGEEELAGRGVYYCAHCDAPVFKHLERARACVVGGGNSAVYTALYLTAYAEEVSLIYRGARLKADPILAEQLRRHPEIRIRLREEPVAVRSEGGTVSCLTIRGAETGRTEDVPTDGVFVGIGQLPLSAPVKGLLERDEGGFILVDAAMATSQPGVFAAGDVVHKTLRQIVTAFGDGAVAADAAIRYLAARSG